jgi:hypothetical protein
LDPLVGSITNTSCWPFFVTAAIGGHEMATGDWVGATSTGLLEAVVDGAAVGDVVVAATAGPAASTSAAAAPMQAR